MKSTTTMKGVSAKTHKRGKTHLNGLVSIKETGLRITNVPKQNGPGLKEFTGEFYQTSK